MSEIWLTEAQADGEVDDDNDDDCASSWRSASSGYLSFDDDDLENEEIEENEERKENDENEERKENDDGKAAKPRRNKIARHNKIVPRASSSSLSVTPATGPFAADSETLDAGSDEALWPDELSQLHGETEACLNEFSWPHGEVEPPCPDELSQLHGEVEAPCPDELSQLHGEAWLDEFSQLHGEVEPPCSDEFSQLHGEVEPPCPDELSRLHGEVEPPCPGELSRLHGEAWLDEFSQLHGEVEPPCPDELSRLHGEDEAPCREELLQPEPYPDEVSQLHGEVEPCPEELPLLYGEVDDLSVHAHPCPDEISLLHGEVDDQSVLAYPCAKSLEWAAEDAPEESVPDTCFLDHLVSPALSVEQPEDESWTDSVDVGISTMDTRYDEMDTRYDEMDTRYNEMDTRYNEMDSRYTEMDSRYDEMGKRYDEMEVYSGSVVDYRGWTYEAHNETEVYRAYFPNYHGWTYEAHVANENYRNYLARIMPPFSAHPSWRRDETALEQHVPLRGSAPPWSPDVAAQARLLSSLQEHNDFYSELHLESAPPESGKAKRDGTQVPADQRTTVMLMNIPFGYTSTKLIRTLDSEGFSGLYNFVYVPMDFKARASRGCALVNLLDPLIAKRFMEAFDGFSGWSTTSRNVCRSHWAKQYQGLQANVDHYRNTSVMGGSVPHEYKPRLFKMGTEIMFPPPTPKAAQPKRRYVKPRKSKKQQESASEGLQVSAV